MQRKLYKKYNKLKIWNKSFIIKNKLENKKNLDIIIFYILNIFIILKDLRRFNF